MVVSDYGLRVLQVAPLYVVRWAPPHPENLDRGEAIALPGLLVLVGLRVEGQPVPLFLFRISLN